MSNDLNERNFVNGIKLVQEIEQGKDHFTNAEWSPSGEILALGSDHGSNYLLWHLESNVYEWRETGAFAGARTISWNPLGERIAVGCYDGTIQIQPKNRPNNKGVLTESNKATGFYHWENLLQLNTVGRNSILSIGWTVNPENLITAHQDGKVILWDTLTGDFINEFRIHTPFEIFSYMTVDPSRSSIAVFGVSSVQIWNAHNFSKDHEIHFEDLNAFGPDCIHWSGDGKYIAVGTHVGIILIIDCKSMSVCKTLTHSQDRVGNICFSADSACLATACDDSVYLWSTTDWESKVKIDLSEKSVDGGLAFHPGKNLIAVGVNGGQKIQVFEYSRSVFR